MIVTPKPFIPSFSPAFLKPFGSQVGFSPLSLNGLIAWYDASDANTITEAGSGVSVWADKSTQGNDLAQTTDTNRPTFDSGGGFILFDGVDNFLTRASFTGGSLTQPNDVFIVFKWVAVPTGVSQTVFDGNLANNLYFASNASGLANRIFAGTTVIDGTENIDTNFSVKSITFDGSSSVIRTNGVNVPLTAGDIGTDGFNGLFLGSRGSAVQPANIQVKEMVIVDSMDDDERNQLGNYLAAKSGLPWSPFPQGFTPLELPNLISWYDGRQGITLNGSNVSQWDDLSGNGNHFTQSLASRQPAYDATNQLLTFSGLNNVSMRVSTFGTGAITQPNTIMTVSQNTDHSVTGFLYDGGGLSTRHFVVYRTSADRIGMAAPTERTTFTGTDTSKRILATIFNGASSLMYRDGVSSGALATVGTDTLNGTFLGIAADGSSAEWTGNIQGMVVVNGLMTDQEINNTANFWKSIYSGLTWVDI